MSKKFMLTTLDNPFNPFKDFDSWKQFDELKDYNTCELLGRETFGSDELSDSVNEELIQQAIESIVDNDLTNLYIKVQEDSRVLVSSSNK